MCRPRAPRAVVEGEAEPEESISTIFREAREQKAADEERRGGGRGKPGGGRSAAGGRPGERRERTPRPPRKREGEPAPVDAAQAQAAPAAPATPKPPRAAAPAGNGEPRPEGERAPRKRRRRRGGRRIEGADALEMQGMPASGSSSKGASTPAAGDAGASADVRPSLLARVAKGLKSLVTRAPRSQH